MFWSINKSVWMNEWQDRTEQNRTDSIMIIIIMMIHFCHNSIFIIQTNKISTKIMHCMNYMLEISFLKCNKNNNNYKSSCHAHHRQRWLWKLNFGQCPYICGEWMCNARNCRYKLHCSDVRSKQGSSPWSRSKEKKIGKSNWHGQ